MAYRIGRCLLGDLLGKKGWSQRELARRSSVSKSNISGYINNDHVMRIHHARNISDTLDCTIEELYEWEWIPPEK